MNVAIKAGALQQALAAFEQLLAEGCSPNVVTYNTLIDVYGKTGQARGRHSRQRPGRRRQL